MAAPWNRFGAQCGYASAKSETASAVNAILGSGKNTHRNTMSNRKTTFIEKQKQRNKTGIYMCDGTFLSYPMGFSMTFCGENNSDIQRVSVTP